MLIDIIAGARPNFVKIYPIVRALDMSIKHGSPVRYRLVHTGQHYDSTMSGDFFKQLGICEPHINLEVGSGSHAEQTGAIMLKYEKLLLKKRIELCLVVGDVNSTMACALTAKKLGIKVAHVEAGIRSGDWDMPEEINRVVTDSITNWFFTTSIYANRNLNKMGISTDRIFFVGNTMIDTLLLNIDRFIKPAFWEKYKLKAKNYIVLTLHRPSNVDQLSDLEEILLHISKACKPLPIVFILHPRIEKKILNSKKVPNNIIKVGAQSYLNFNYLVKNAKAVVTDSGGVTEETTVFGVPCMTFRNSTERLETVTFGTNELLGTDPKTIKPFFDKLFADQWKVGKIPEKWDGKAAFRIVRELEKLLS